MTPEGNPPAGNPAEDQPTLSEALAGAFGAPKEEAPGIKIEDRELKAPEDKATSDAEGVKGEADPLATLDIETVIKHPVQGPLLQHRIDTAANAQARAILEQERPRIVEQVKQELISQTIEQHFDSLSKQEIAEEIANDSKAAVAYAQVMEKKLREPQDAVQEAETRIYAGQVSLVLDLIKESGLSELAATDPEIAKVMKTLDPNNYTHLGVAGIREWNKAVDAAIVEHKAQKAYEAKVEADKQANLADRDPDRPPDLTPGRKTGPRKDIMAFDSSQLLEEALAKRANNPDRKPQ